MKPPEKPFFKYIGQKSIPKYKATKGKNKYEQGIDKVYT